MPTILTDVEPRTVVIVAAAARLFDGHADSIVEDPLIEVAGGRIVGVAAPSHYGHF